MSSHVFSGIILVVLGVLFIFVWLIAGLLTENSAGFLLALPVLIIGALFTWGGYSILTFKKKSKKNPKKHH